MEIKKSHTWILKANGALGEYTKKQIRIINPTAK